jgi:uncharacterized membrane protein YcaP (DUF421 family)
MFEMSTDWWEIIVRVVLVYVGLLVMVRLSGKRQLGQLAPMDLLTLLLVSETVSPALTGEESSVTGGMLAAGTLFVLTLVIAVLAYRLRGFEAISEGTPRVLIRDGQLFEKVMASERITVQELGTALRMNGVQTIDEVMLAMVEPSGVISFITRNQ